MTLVKLYPTSPAVVTFPVLPLLIAEAFREVDPVSRLLINLYPRSGCEKSSKAYCPDAFLVVNEAIVTPLF